MEDVDLAFAKEHLEDLIARAARGEDVRIVDPKLGVVKLQAVDAASKPKRMPGRWRGLPPPADDFFEPLSESELKLWNGEGA